MRRGLAVAWYRCRATFGRRVGGSVALVLLIATLGALAMGSLAAARRTQSSYPALLAAAHASDLGLTVAAYDAAAHRSGYDPKIVSAIRHLPHVEHVESWAALNFAVLNSAGQLDARTNVQAGAGSGSVDGLYFDQDRATAIEGRVADPNRADEFMTNAAAAKFLGLRVGDVLHLAVFTNAQTTSPDFGTNKLAPYRRIAVKMTGIVEFDEDVVRDDIDATGDVTVQFTPALTRQLLQCCVPLSGVALRLDHGSRDVPAVEKEIQQIAPPGQVPQFTVTSLVEAKAEHGIKPESIALAVFGGIVAFALLLIAGQVITRQLRADTGDLEVLRALGAGPTMTALDGLVAILGSIVVGSLLAVVLAVAISPLAPLGPVRAIDPSPGVNFDWAVLGCGLAVLVVGLSAIAAITAYRRAPHRVARRGVAVPRGSSVARMAAASDLPQSAVTGIRFALGPGAGRDRVPVRSAIIGAALAIFVVTATVTFGASLDALVSRPALYGWNWNYELSAGNGNGDIPAGQAAQLLDHARSVATWTGVYFGSLEFDGLAVPVIAGRPHASVTPPLLSGHAVTARDQVVLGADTLAQLGKHVGDTVSVTDGSSAPTRLRIVGTATMPTTGVTGNLHPTIGTGAVVSDHLLSAASKNPFSDPEAGPNAIFVDLRPGTDRAAALRELRRIAKATSSVANFGVAVVAVQRPAEIVNYRSMGSTPAYLGAALGVGATVAFALTLIASVRRRRHDLALLKTLGFTRRQIIAVVAWQSSVAVTIGVLVGMPLGIIVGRALWDVFADSIHVVPSPTVPALTVVLLGLGALLLANLVATVPARQAARIRPALLLHVE